jgi:hypothetical protein
MRGQRHAHAALDKALGLAICSNRFNGSTTRSVAVDLHDIRTKDDAEAEVSRAQAAPYATKLSIY